MTANVLQRKGIEQTVTVLVAIVLVLIAGAFLLFVLTTGADDTMNQLQNSLDTVQSELGERIDRLKTLLANVLQSTDQKRSDDPDQPDPDNSDSSDTTS